MNTSKALIICTVALFQTVTLSNAAVQTTVAQMSNPQAVCTYAGKTYRQDEHWTDDGCKFKCVCTDAMNGQYQCREICPHWDLPDICHWNPAPSGKCCRRPECPGPFHMTHYPDD